MRNIHTFCKASDIKSEYQKKLVTADEAAKFVKSGDTVHLGTFGSIARDYEAAMAKRADELEDVVIITSLWSYTEQYKTFEVDPEGKHFRLHSTHMSKKDRVVNKAGKGWYVPVVYNETVKNYEECVGTKVNIFVMPVAPMDAYGNFNMGITVGEYIALINSADLVILEVNKKMPHTCGTENYINIAHADYIYETEYDLPELPVRDSGEADAKIAESILPLIESGSCLQLGIGAMPNRLGKLIAESDINDLSVHTEMLVDSFVDLYNAGKITGNKNIDKGKMVYTFALGTKKLYDFIENNPVCRIAPVDYVNNPAVIASIDKMVSINSCLQIDLYGQVNSETIGHMHISGTGGQINFVQGAYASKGGKSFLCTASTKTKADGTRESLILPFMPPGSQVTSPRYSTHYLVTEYGIACVKNKSTWEIAESIINIAHPDFREELIKNAEKQGIWRNSSKLL
jgi:acyl-CoA hydrolase